MTKSEQAKPQMVIPKKPKIYKPTGHQHPMALRWKGTVVPKVFPSALICTIVAVIVTVLYKETSNQYRL
ncbi:12777_t:CDS:2 [Ambispora leptoticha]|uniref:12777_t:CDS:1 n=1 Tax=Ambispora leptoticha TaxID=144679 RepID=A0A9N9BVC3_9GLOM|nr:12777_t:CDS:2 [Ambispora leptoticha]